MPISQPIARENRVIFSRGEREIHRQRGGRLRAVRGEIDPLWKEFVRIGGMRSTGERTGLELDDSALDSAAIAFRYQHDLITAEETERWLEDRGVSLGEFSEYFASPILGPLVQRCNASPPTSSLPNGSGGRERSFSG